MGLALAGGPVGGSVIGVDVAHTRTLAAALPAGVPAVQHGGGFLPGQMIRRAGSVVDEIPIDGFHRSTSQGYAHAARNHGGDRGGTAAATRTAARHAPLRSDIGSAAPGSLARMPAMGLALAGGSAGGSVIGVDVAHARTLAAVLPTGVPAVQHGGGILPGKVIRRARSDDELPIDGFHRSASQGYANAAGSHGGGQGGRAAAATPAASRHSAGTGSAARRSPGTGSPGRGASTRSGHDRRGPGRLTASRSIPTALTSPAGPAQATATNRTVPVGPVGPVARSAAPAGRATTARGLAGATSARGPAGAAQALAPSARPTVAPPGTTPLGRRFLGALHRRPADRDEPLPVQLRPLAQLVVGSHRAASVRISTGPASAEALAAVGRPAATVGNVIHLAAAPAKSVRSAEVVAHELVHAARPSPVPRFFQDDHDTAEERQAALTGGLVRDLAAKTMERGGIATALQRRVEGSRSHRSNHLLFGTTGLAVAPGASPLTAGTMAEVAASGRSSSSAAPGAVTTSGPTGDSSVRAPGGAPAPSADPARTIHRRRPGGRHRLEPPDATLPPALARLLDRPDSFSPPGADRDQRGPEDSFPDGPKGPRPSTRSGGPMSASFTQQPFVEASTHPVSQETLDWIVEAVEERILSELERRGLRFQPGVF